MRGVLQDKSWIDCTPLTDSYFREELGSIWLDAIRQDGVEGRIPRCCPSAGGHDHFVSISSISVLESDSRSIENCSGCQSSGKKAMGLQYDEGT